MLNSLYKRIRDIGINTNNTLFENDLENNNQSFQEWLKIKEITNNGILFKSKSVTILRVQPINFNLKSELEKKAILEQYKSFLKNLNSKIQIIVSNRKTDIKNHIEKIIQSTEENPKIYELSKEYINLIKSVVNKNGTYTKEFFVVIESKDNVQNEIIKISEYLSNCGNEVEVCPLETTKSMLRNFVNKRQENLI